MELSQRYRNAPKIVDHVQLTHPAHSLTNIILRNLYVYADMDRRN